MNRIPTLRLLTAAALAAVVGACSGDSPTPTDLTERMPDARTFSALQGLPLPGEESTDTYVQVCKLSYPYVTSFAETGTAVDDGTLSRTFNFDVDAAPGGTLVTGADNLAIQTSQVMTVSTDDNCWTVWTGPVGTDVSVREILDPTTTVLNTVTYAGLNNARDGRTTAGVNETDFMSLGDEPYEYVIEVQAGGAQIFFKNSTIEVDEQPDPLAVEKTAIASYDRTHEWSLEKTVNPTSHSGVPGDEFQSIWTVTATKVTEDDNFQVTGVITVTNSNDFAVPFTLTDVLDDGTAGAINCGAPTNDNTGTVLANGSVDCSYTASPTDASATENTVTVTSDVVGGDSDTEGFDWTVNVFGDDEVTLSDPRVLYTNDISVSTTELFPENFVCPTDLSLYDANGVYTETYTNDAYLDGPNGTDLEDSAEVRITCRTPVEFEGCTPGYWRQEQHFGNWVGYTRDELFGDVFGVIYGGTLLEAVWARGGGANALARHAVAALLNSTNDGVMYPYSTDQVIAFVQAAFASGDFESAKNVFEAANELGCDLGRAEDPEEEEQGPPSNRGRRGGR